MTISNKFKIGNAAAFSNNPSPGRIIEPLAYRDLSTDSPQGGRSYEVQPGIPIDGSKKSLRNYSPFRISILPPLAFDSIELEPFVSSIFRGADELGGEPGDVFTAVAENIGSFGEDELVGSEFEFEFDDGSGNLSPGSEGSEVERQREELGLNGPAQYRSVGNASAQSGDLFAVASRSLDTFSEAKQRRVRNALFSTATATGGEGQGINKLKTSSFIALGQSLRNDDGTFSSPGFIDKLVAVDIAAQIQTILQIPPLTLLINPTSLSINHNKVQQFSQRTRSGYVYQAWGDEQPVLSISGTIGAFIAGVNPDVGTVLEGALTPSVSGVQFASKRDSAAYQNLMNLLLFYKNNGYIYDNIGRSNAHQFVGALAIEYDQWVYIGHMNSFSWGYDESDTVNGKLSYELEFTVSQMFDTHQPTEVLKPLESPTPSPGDVRWYLGSNSNGQLEPGVDVFRDSQGPEVLSTGSSVDLGSFEDAGRSQGHQAEPGSAFEDTSPPDFEFDDGSGGDLPDFEFDDGSGGDLPDFDFDDGAGNI